MYSYLSLSIVSDITNTVCACKFVVHMCVYLYIYIHIRLYMCIYIETYINAYWVHMRVQFNGRALFIL